MIDSDTKFNRARKGYDPQEVDSVLEEYQWQIADLKRQNSALSDNVTQYEAKIALLTESVKWLEEELKKVSSQQSEAVNVISRQVERHDEDALKKASKILWQAQTSAREILERAQLLARETLKNARKATENAGKQSLTSFLSARMELIKLGENMRNLCHDITDKSEYFSALNRGLSDKPDGSPAASDADTALPTAFEAPPEISQDEAAQPVQMRQTNSAYENYMKNIKQLGNMPK